MSDLLNRRIALLRLGTIAAAVFSVTSLGHHHHGPGQGFGWFVTAAPRIPMAAMMATDRLGMTMAATTTAATTITTTIDDDSTTMIQDDDSSDDDCLTIWQRRTGSTSRKQNCSRKHKRKP